MNGNLALRKRIEELEARAAESDAAAERTNDAEARLYNVSLARKLRAIASRLRSASADAG